MSTPAPSTDDLQRAWRAMRDRPGLQGWPTSFEEVMRDQRRALCVAIEARAARHAAERAQKSTWPAACQDPHRRPPRAVTTATDVKRAAAGDRDD